MKQPFLFSGLLLLAASSLAQTPDSLSEAARNFMQAGDYPNAIMVYNNSLKQKPGDLELLENLSFAYYLQKNYSQALETAKPVVDRKDANEKAYQILGLIYKAIDDKKEIDKMYRSGIKRFPASGALYNDYGELLWASRNTDAIRYWEKGIEMEPNYSSNYYNAAKYYYLSFDKVWPLIYGEIFLNLESYSRRTPEMKKLLLDSYRKLYTDIKTPKSQANRNGFAQAVQTVYNDQGQVVTLGITAESLGILRSRFILEWFDKYGMKYPLRLFEFQRQLLKEGLFDAYNQWIFGVSANLPAFQNWSAEHAQEYNRFTDYQKGRVFKIPGGQAYHAPTGKEK